MLFALMVRSLLRGHRFVWIVILMRFARTAKSDTARSTPTARRTPPTSPSASATMVTTASHPDASRVSRASTASVARPLRAPSTPPRPRAPRIPRSAFVIVVTTACRMPTVLHVRRDPGAGLGSRTRVRPICGLLFAPATPETALVTTATTTLVALHPASLAAQAATRRPEAQVTAPSAMPASSQSPQAPQSRPHAPRATSDPSVPPRASTSASSAPQDTLHPPSVAPSAPRASLAPTPWAAPLPASRAARGLCRPLWLVRRPRYVRPARLVLGRPGILLPAIFVVLVLIGPIRLRCSFTSKVLHPFSTTQTSTSVSPSAASTEELSWLQGLHFIMSISSLGPSAHSSACRDRGGAGGMRPLLRVSWAISSMPSRARMRSVSISTSRPGIQCIRRSQRHVLFRITTITQQ